MSDCGTSTTFSTSTARTPAPFLTNCSTNVGTRIPAANIIGSLADGMTSAEVQAAYPQLLHEDILAALAYAAEVLRDEMIAPLAA